jgi:hypothetical protein
MEASNKFSGSEWGEYSEAEFRWLNKVLTEGIISNDDLFELSKHFGINFSDKSIPEDQLVKEIGYALVADIPKSEVLPIIAKLVKEKYPEYQRKEGV